MNIHAVVFLHTGVFYIFPLAWLSTPISVRHTLTAPCSEAHRKHEYFPTYDQSGVMLHFCILPLSLKSYIKSLFRDVGFVFSLIHCTYLIYLNKVLLF